MLGQPDFVTNASAVTREGMTSLRAVFGDSAGRLYVVQEGSHRMTIYEQAATRANGAPADYVWGQADFVTGTAASPPTSTSLNTPRAVYVDEARGDVYLADYDNNRVLRYTVQFNPTSGEEGATARFTLEQNQPNPFRAVTAIRFSLPSVTSHVSVTVLDLLGRPVATLVDGPLDAGDHTVRFDASRLAAGVYVCRMQAGEQVMVRRMIVTK